jgi:hypothetical protein
MLTISTILNNHLFNVVEDLRARLDYKESRLRVYETNQAQIEACDRQTWMIAMDSACGSVWDSISGEYIPDTLDTMEVR